MIHILSYYASLVHPVFVPFSLLLFVLNTVLVFLWLAVFPDGRIYPRWMLRPIPILAVWETLRYIAIYIIRTPELLALRPYVFYITTSFTVMGLIAQFFRYRRIATPEQRQQTKWILLLLAIFVASSMTISAVRGWSHLTGQIEIELAVEFVYTVWVLILSTFGCIALWRAITRRNLWQLDLTINRSLVALGVTVVLGVIFAGLFFLLQAVLRAIFGTHQGELAVGLAAALTVMLFQTVRQRVRHIVDRQIYRLRFDLDELARKQQKPKVEKPGFLTGQVVGGYELLGVVGRGGMGEVYKGYSAQNEHLTAIKIKALNC